MSLRKIAEWIVKGDVSENIFLQMGIGGIIIGFVIALYPLPTVKLIERIQIFEGLMTSNLFNDFLWFVSYVVPVIIGMYGARLLINGILQSMPEDD